MIIVIIILSFYVCMSTGTLLYQIISEEKEPWADVFAVLLFIFLPPIWGIVRICYTIYWKHNQKKRKK